MFDMYQTEDVWQSVVFVRLIDPRTKRVLACAIQAAPEKSGGAKAGAGERVQQAAALLAKFG